MQRKSKKNYPQTLDEVMARLKIVSRNLVELTKAEIYSGKSFNDLIKEQSQLASLQLKLIKQVCDHQSHQVQNKRPERIMPSDAVCFDCPFNKRCQLKGLGIPLCPQLTKMNNDYKNGRYCYVSYVDQCLQKEKIKLN